MKFGRYDRTFELKNLEFTPYRSWNLGLLWRPAYLDFTDEKGEIHRVTQEQLPDSEWFEFKSNDSSGKVYVSIRGSHPPILFEGPRKKLEEIRKKFSCLFRPDTHCVFGTQSV